MFGSLKINRKQKSFRPCLEGLEDRVVLDTMRWRGTISSDWITPGNWFNATKGATATRAPDTGDTCHFQAGQPNVSLTNLSGACARLVADSGWSG
jgi:hypothetical protein